MTTSTAKFYKMKGSLSSGEFPLFATNQNLSTYMVHSVTVKYAKGLQTSITVPSFTGYDTVNIVELDDKFYWATAWRESTTYNGSITYTLDFAAPTSFFRSGTSVKGNWHKLPSNNNPYLKDSITNDVYIEDSSVSPTDLEVGIVQHSSLLPNLDQRGYWYHIIGYDSSNNLKKWAGFLPLVVNDNKLVELGNVYVKANTGIVKNIYPNFYDLLKNINRYTGLDGDKVIDFSVSTRCPFTMEKTTVNTTYKAIRLYDVTNVAIDPTMVYDGYDANGDRAQFYLYDISSYYKPASQTITLTMTDLQVAIGDLSVKDWNGNSIMSLINESSKSIRFQTVDDINGIYTIIKSDNQIIAVPEGRLPYLSNSWENYVAYQMDTDREIMDNAIKYAQYEKETNTITGIANATVNAVSTGVMTGVMAGNPAGAAVGVASGIAGTAISLYENQRALELTTMKARDDFYLSQRQARLEPQTAYNVGYGTIYCIMNNISPLRVSIAMPRTVGQSYYNDWVAEFGYPAEGVQSVSISNGFYQGKLLSDSLTKSGMYWDECNKTFMNGFKFISP